jgi:hypothetical protein
MNAAFYESTFERAFVCPQCSSTYYGTDNPGAPRELWVGRCKSCSFT